MKAGWGRPTGTSARLALWLIGGLAIVSLALLSGMWDDTQARVAAAGSWCERTGPHTAMGLVSDDGGATWQRP